MEPSVPQIFAGPPSPCTKVCTLDGQGYCIGCLRTGTEIGQWLSMSAAEQWALVAELERRRKLFAGASSIAAAAPHQR